MFAAFASCDVHVLEAECALIEQVRLRRVQRRLERLPLGLLVPVGLRLRRVRGGQPILLRAHLEPNELALERGDRLEVHRAAQRHVGRAAVAAEHGDVGQRRLEPASHQRGAERQVVGDLVGDHDVPWAEGASLDPASHDAHRAVRDPELDGLVAQRTVELVVIGDRQPATELRRARHVHVRGRPEPDALAEPGGVAESLERPEDALGRQRVAADELEGVNVRVLVMQERADDVRPVFGPVDALVEVVAIPVGVRLELGANEVVVALVLSAVQEVDALRRTTHVDHEFHHGGARHVVVPGTASEPRPRVRVVYPRSGVRVARRGGLLRPRAGRRPTAGGEQKGENYASNHRTQHNAVHS